MFSYFYRCFCPLEEVYALVITLNETIDKKQQILSAMLLNQQDEITNDNFEI